MGVVYLIRHGQASFGAADYDQLSETGFEQSRVLGTALRERLPQVDSVIIGPLVRHRQTAEACLDALGLKLQPQREPGFDEFEPDELIARNTPEYADRTRLLEYLASTTEPRRAFQELFTAAVARWVAGRHDGEYSISWSAFQQRSLQAMDAVIRALGGSKTALVFTSGGPITAICQDLLGLSNENAFRLNWPQANCSVSKVVFSERSRFLSTFNDHGHFEGVRRALLTYR